MDSTETPSGRAPIRLESLFIASPCAEPWEAMVGSERVRHCDRCKQNVYNLSEMTLRQGLTLISEKEGRLCVRMSVRRDGTVVTRDCRERLRALRGRGRWGLVLFLLLFFPVTLGAQIFGWLSVNGKGACRVTDPGSVVESRTLQGDVALPPRVLLGSPVAPRVEPVIRMGKVKVSPR